MAKKAIFATILLLLSAVAFALVPYHTASQIENGTLTGTLTIAKKTANCGAAIGKTDSASCDEVLARIGTDDGYGLSSSKTIFTSADFKTSKNISTKDIFITAGGKIRFADNTEMSSAPSASAWQASGSNIFFSNGNVGIGTNTPLEKFHVSSGNLKVSGGDIIAGDYSYVQRTVILCKPGGSCPSGTPYCPSGTTWIDLDANGAMDVGKDVCMAKGAMISDNNANALDVAGNTDLNGNLNVDGMINVATYIRGATYGFGGSYMPLYYGYIYWQCNVVNPFTGGCSCPSGFSASQVAVTPNGPWILYGYVCYK